MIAVHHSDCVAWLTARAAAIAAGDAAPFDACVTDPPYHLTSIVKRFGKPGSAAAKVGATGAYARASKGFMGKEWDGGDVAFRPETWAAVYDCLKPGAHLVAFSGTRTYHRMVCAIEDAGFEIRDQLAWVYGSGFPKSHDVAKGIDQAAGAVRQVRQTRKVKVGFDPTAQGGGGWAAGELRITAPATPEAAQWEGWGTALKPAWEPIVLARKPLGEKSVAANVLAHGTGAVNVDACRVGTDGATRKAGDQKFGWDGTGSGAGRWPANIVHDGSDAVLAGFPETGQMGSGLGSGSGGIWSESTGRPAGPQHGDSGSASRFFYSAKAGPLDRIGTAHATVKAVDLMRWLVRLVTPPGGQLLDPFAGSGKTGIAALAEGFGCTMIDIEAEHVADIERQLAFLRGEGAVGLIERHKARIDRAAAKGGGGSGDLPLFAA